MIRVAITGGIGSGKSTVCALFAQRGIAVYDSDSEAKRLMTSSPRLRQDIIAAFGEESYCDEGLNRVYLASVVFSDEQQRQRLNSIVHPAVAADFCEWCDRQSGEYVIFESAILFDSSLADMFDVTIAVVAPVELRIERTCRRDGATPESVERRIAAQMSDDEMCRRADITIVNIERAEVESDVVMLDARIRAKSNIRGEVCS